MSEARASEQLCMNIYKTYSYNARSYYQQSKREMVCFKASESSLSLP